MRYLGEVERAMKEKNYQHIKVLLEKEAVYRSFKHIINDHMRETSDTYLSSVIAHLLNLLLAPFPMIDAMNEGKIEF